MHDALAWYEGQVAITNHHEVPARFTDARQPIPVRARIAWATGDETIETYAVAWTSQLVLVQLSDRRYQLRGLWLAVRDLERREDATLGAPRPRRGTPA